MSWELASKKSSGSSFSPSSFFSPDDRWKAGTRSFLASWLSQQYENLSLPKKKTTYGLMTGATTSWGRARRKWFLGGRESKLLGWLGVGEAREKKKKSPPTSHMWLTQDVTTINSLWSSRYRELLGFRDSAREIFFFCSLVLFSKGKDERWHYVIHKKQIKFIILDYTLVLSKTIY